VVANVAIGVVVCGLAATASAVGELRVNLSPSIPVGVYVARPVPSRAVLLPRGQLVALCLGETLAAWARARGYLRRGSCPDGSSPIGKPIFGIAGDTLEVTRAGISRNGVPAARTRALDTDAAGRPLPRVPPGRYLVPPGEIWVVSSYDTRSWDSRYFGPVPLRAVISLLRPLWTVRSMPRG
jgi:conjugative transfer signal peptidase TraF